MLIKRNHIPMLLLCIAVIAVFSNTLINGFVWDDKPLFLSNPAFKEFNLKEIFFSLAGGFEYTPIVSLFLCTEYAVFGTNPFGYHMVNILLYLSTVLLVYRLSQRLICTVSKSIQAPDDVQRTAFVSALLFAVHPLHTEVVAWVCANNILLSGIFFLLSCNSYIDWLPGDRKFSDRTYVSALLFFFLASSTKPTAIILPLLLLLFLVFYDEKKTLMRLLHLIPFFMVSLLFYLLHKTVATQVGRINEGLLVFSASNILSKITVAAQIPFFYLKKFFLPFDLTIEYGDDFFSPFSYLPELMALTGICAIAFFAYATRKKYPEIPFGLGWMVITLIPVLNIFSTSPIVADRYFYLPLFGPVLVIAVLTAKNRRLMYALCGFFFILWASITIIQNSTWKSNETLWGHSLKTSGSGMSFLGYSEELINQGKFEKALDAVSGIKDPDERKGIYTYMHGTILNKRGDFAGALSVLESSYSLSRNSVHYLFLLADTYEKAGKTEAAITVYKETIAKSKGYTAITLGKLSRAALDRLAKDTSQLVDNLRKDVVLNPTDIKKRNMLAMQLDHLGLYDEALTHYLELERNGERTWQLFFNIASVYKKTQNYENSLIYYNKSQALKPDYIDTINNIGTVYEKLGRYDRAIYYYNLAISKEPKYAYAYFNLASLYFKTGDKTKSLNLFNYTIQNFPHLREKAEPFLQQMQ